MGHLVVHRWTSAQFYASREAWSALHGRSSADPLFMSWDWVTAWWRHHGEALEGELCVLAIHSEQGELVGIAPFYVHAARHLGLIPVRRMELIGNTWRDSRAVFSEYLDLIAHTDHREGVCRSIVGWLHATSLWDELVLCNIREDSIAQLIASQLQGRTHVRRAETLTAWHIDLPESFQAFTTHLSSNTRRKLLHQREKLQGLVVASVPAESRPQTLERLETMVARRFGTRSETTSDVRARFHADLVEKGIAHGSIRLTELGVAGGSISIMLNVRLRGAEYYLQSGFDPSNTHGISPGLLHLGYAIEAACQDRLRRFELLGGWGRHRDYKQDLATGSTLLFTLHVVRRPVLRALFRCADALRGRTSHKAPGEG